MISALELLRPAAGGSVLENAMAADRLASGKFAASRRMTVAGYRRQQAPNPYVGVLTWAGELLESSVSDVFTDGQVGRR